jgi:hypothetical protein
VVRPVVLKNLAKVAWFAARNLRKVLSFPLFSVDGITSRPTFLRLILPLTYLCKSVFFCVIPANPSTPAKKASGQVAQGGGQACSILRIDTIGRTGPPKDEARRVNCPSLHFDLLCVPAFDLPLKSSVQIPFSAFSVFHFAHRSVLFFGM